MRTPLTLTIILGLAACEPYSEQAAPPAQAQSQQQGMQDGSGDAGPRTSTGNSSSTYGRARDTARNLQDKYDERGKGIEDYADDID